MISTNLWQQYFKCYELDEIMRQKDDKSWAELLKRLREGISNSVISIVKFKQK